MPSPSRTSNAPCSRSRSDSEPTRMPTSVSGTGDVPPEPHARELYAGGGVVRGGSRAREVVAERRDVEDAPAVRDEAPVVERGPRVEDERARRLGVADAADGRTGVSCLRIAARR